MGLAEFVAVTNSITSPVALFEALTAEAERQGFEYAAYGALTYRPPSTAEARPPAVLLNYPTDWQAHYFQQQYQEIDPVVTLTPLLAKPFSWQQLLAGGQLNAKQRQLFAEAAASGLRHGLSVPLHGPWGRVAVVSFASPHGDGLSAADLRHFYLLAHQFHAVMEDLGATAIPPEATAVLSTRERDCLSWTAQGKSSWDISVILGISQNTVNFHLKNALRKLRANSRMVAALKAVRLGLIDPSRVV